MNKSKKVAKEEIENDEKKFVGFACVTAGVLRTFRFKIIDSRSYFIGHADLYHLYTMPSGQPTNEPLDPEIRKALKELNKSLINACTFYLDNTPEKIKWGGPCVKEV